MADTPATLDEIVTSSVMNSTAALKDHLAADGSVNGTVTGKPDEQNTQETEDKAKLSTESSETTTESSEVDEFGLTKQQQIEARQLLAALRDPAKAPTVIDFLARQGGYEKPETKSEAVQVKKGMVADLKEALGPELEYLADKMGPIIEKALKDQVEESQKSIKSRLDAAEVAKNEELADQAQDSLGKEYFGADGAIPDKLLGKMNELMDEIPVRPNQSMKSYLERLLIVAAAETSTTLTKKTAAQSARLTRNRNDAPARLASEARVTPKVGETAVHPKTQMSLLDSIQAAIERTNSELK